ncbi:unnamed protein product [Cladocopium goreaui]|uniref:Uncharacterized protein n=1 Tax=Cladocopium goreaui TaxID=2562237 RepID=A0A9P1GDC7_9DINO|nr:unnamed protein product [Cladocopium goreaui]
MAVIQPEGQITWGGAVLPRIETLDPRIRKVALERYYLPKLIEDGYARDPVIGRVIAAAEGRSSGSSFRPRVQRRTRRVERGGERVPKRKMQGRATDLVSWSLFNPVSMGPVDGFSLEMSDAGGVPTLSLSLSTNLKISVPELLQTLMSVNGGAPGTSLRQETESRSSMANHVAQARKVAEGPIAPFKNSPSYADYVQSNNWQGYQHVNTLVLNDEKMLRSLGGGQELSGSACPENSPESTSREGPSWGVRCCGFSGSTTGLDEASPCDVEIATIHRANAMTRYDESPGRSVAGGRVARNSPVDEKRLREQWSKNPPGVRQTMPERTMQASQRSTSLPSLREAAAAQHMVFQAPGTQVTQVPCGSASQGYIAGPRAKWGPVARMLA